MAINIFTYLGGRIEAGALTQITTVSTNISGNLIPFLAAGLTIWVMAYAFAVMRGEAQEPMNRFVWDLTKKAFILTFALNIGMYQSNIVADVNMVTNLLTNSINTAGTGNCTVASNDSRGIYAALDCSFSLFRSGIDEMVDAGNKLLFSDTPDSVLDKAKRLTDVFFILFLSYGSLVLVTLASMVMYALIFFEVVVVRIILTMLFALGPLFIAAFVFEPTKKYCEAWVSKLVYCIILQLIIVLFIGISVGIISGFLIETMNKISSESDFALYATHLTSTAPILIITMITLAFVFLRLPGLAGELTGHNSSSSGIGAFVGGAVGGGLGAFKAIKSFGKRAGAKGGGEISGK